MTLSRQLLEREKRGRRDRLASRCSTAGKPRTAARFSGARLARWCLALLVVAALLSAGVLQGQQQQPQSRINVDVKVVNVLATVRDKHGMIVSNLGKDDFVLTEDGKPQAISYFSRETDVPLTMGLLVDTSGSELRMLDDERSASHSFLDVMLREDRDKAFVIHFDHQVELLQDLTNSRDKLEKALGLLGRPEFSRQDSGDPRARGGRRGGGGTLLYDAVYLASDEVIKKQQGRKALIVLSDGVDRGSKESLETAIETAQRADTVVYSILYAAERPNQNPFGGFGGGGAGRRGGRGRFPQDERTDGKKVLERLSRETGGRLFEVSKKQTIDQIYSSIEEDLRNEYSLGYAPGADVTPGYHKLQLATKQKDYAVQARDGYYAER
jgi:VWFA-related protein